jgi:hypothetical protein
MIFAKRRIAAMRFRSWASRILFGGRVLIPFFDEIGIMRASVWIHRRSGGRSRFIHQFTRIRRLRIDDEIPENPQKAAFVELPQIYFRSTISAAGSYGRPKVPQPNKGHPHSSPSALISCPATSSTAEFPKPVCYNSRFRNGGLP